MTREVSGAEMTAETVVYSSVSIRSASWGSALRIAIRLRHMIQNMVVDKLENVRCEG